MRSPSLLTLLASASFCNVLTFINVILSFLVLFSCSLVAVLSTPLLDEDFVNECLAIKAPYPIPGDTLVPSTASVDVVVPVSTRLTDKYPNAYSDFYGSGTPCVYKTGPQWLVRKGPEAQGIYREARPVYSHPIGAVWKSTGERMCRDLKSVGVEWTSINPLAYANAGEAKPFCPLLISVGVKPHSLVYDDAVAAAAVVKKILDEAGFGDIEVAFVESVVNRSAGAGRKLLSFDPLHDDVPDVRKPFTPTLGLGIAPLKYPYYEGTAALYFRLGNQGRVAVLTCAHVARPPPVYANTGMTRTKPSQPLEEVVALGNKGYSNAVEAIMDSIGGCVRSIDAWAESIDWLDKEEGSKVTKRRNELLGYVEKAKEDVKALNTIHNYVTKHLTTPNQRVIGFVLHSQKIDSAEPYGYTEDWALIELYHKNIDWSTFKGNKVFVGGNVSIADYGKIMFPLPAERATYRYPRDGLLQACGVVEENEIRAPRHRDASGEPCLFVVKNGLTTGTTFGRANGLESFTRFHDHYDIEHTAIEIAVLSYDKKHGNFSDPGDSGSIVLDRNGRIVGILTGGSGPTDTIDITYITPYWWLEQKIKAKFAQCYLYEVINTRH